MQNLCHTPKRKDVGKALSVGPYTRLSISVIALFLPHNNPFPAHLQSPNMESAWAILEHAPLPVLYTHALYKYT